MYFFREGHEAACEILAPQPGINPGPLVEEVQSPTSWTTRGSPGECNFWLCLKEPKENEGRNLPPAPASLCYLSPCDRDAGQPDQTVREPGEHWGSRARRKDSAQAVSQPLPLPGCASASLPLLYCESLFVRGMPRPHH